MVTENAAGSIIAGTAWRKVMGRDRELPDTELTILESIRNLLRAWFIIWLILTLLGTFGLIVLCAEILTRG